MKINIYNINNLNQERSSMRVFPIFIGHRSVQDGLISNWKHIFDLYFLVKKDIATTRCQVVQSRIRTHDPPHESVS